MLGSGSEEPPTQGGERARWGLAGPDVTDLPPMPGRGGLPTESIHLARKGTASTREGHAEGGPHCARLSPSRPAELRPA